MQVTLKHPRTGDQKVVGTGWSYWGFFSCLAFGLPLFFKGLFFWGIAALLLTLASMALQLNLLPGGNSQEFLWTLEAIWMGLTLFFVFMGNSMIAKRYFSLGYEFIDPEATDARIAARKWNL